MVKILLIVGVVKVLFAKVSVPVNVAKSPSVRAALNSARVPVRVFAARSMVLLVKVSVVSLPTSVVVAVGRVMVPVLTIVDITGAVNVLFANVCESVVPTIVPDGTDLPNTCVELRTSVPLIL